MVFNNSKVVLTDATENVLNWGLKLAVLPLKLDITQLLTDFRKFERTMVWHEFLFERESEDTYESPLFRQNNQIFLKTTLLQKDFKTI